MSQTSFDTLAARYPNLAEPFHKIDGWLKTHPGRREIDVRDLGKNFPKLDALSLAYAVEVAITEGALRRVYMVVTPSGVLADGTYEDPLDIPDFVMDRFNHPFPTIESDIVPILIVQVKQSK